MVRLGDPVDATLESARALSALGLKVFPAKYRDKFPLVKWEQFQNTDSTPMVDKWFKNRGNLNFWVLTGTQSGYIVVDCDSAEGDAWWRERIGGLMDATACVKTSKGHHYWFKIPDDWEGGVPSWGAHPKKGDAFKESFDLRADGTGVIAPPSIHETGVQYTWERDLDHAVDATPAMMDDTYRGEAPRATGDAEDTTTGTGGQTRSMLSRLLGQPPGGEGSGRNDWLARVAGHYAKTYHNHEDLYEAHCLQANHSMGDPLDEDEFRKTIDSVWKGEHERNEHRAMNASCGYLASGTTVLLCQVIYKDKDGENTTYDFSEYADFDLQAKGVMTDEAGKRTYWAEIVRRSRGGASEIERLDVVLRAEVLGDDRAIRKFLAAYACTIVPPDNMWPKSGSPGVRLQRYLEAQNPPVVTINPALGWDDDALGEGVGGYVTHDGAITATGPVGIDQVAVRADPRLRSGGTAPHEYGFEHNPVIARDVLREVLTFHDESVTSVFGAWWAACLLKPQIERRTSLFPFMAIEAPSESGKTNGYFQMMTQLNGNTRGETQPTKAALRDMAAGHRNGAVWVDDLDDPAYLLELLRAATSGGSLTKMGEDRESVKNTHIVSPIVISGEALGLGTQKALVDRAVSIKAPSPTSRRSSRDASRPQWDDILAVREQFPQGLHVLAGWYVQKALGAVDKTIEALRAGRTGGSGRSSDKVAVLRAGARLLDYLVDEDDPWAGGGLHSQRVEEWLVGHLIDDTGVAITSNENALTLELVPWALRNWKFPDKATEGRGLDLDTPVFVRGFKSGEGGEAALTDEVSIHFNCALLAEAWKRNEHGRQEKRTTTGDALKDQAMALGAKAKRVKVSQSNGRLAYYFELKGQAARVALVRALGA